jgi:hypothetical protein
MDSTSVGFAVLVTTLDRIFGVGFAHPVEKAISAVVPTKPVLVTHASRVLVLDQKPIVLAANRASDI